MSELRWALFVLGALFVVGLFAFERRRRGAAAAGARAGPAGDAPGSEPQPPAERDRGRRGVPSVVLPQMSVRAPGDPLPVIDVAGDRRLDPYAVPALRLDWPQEGERQILAARILPRGERFGGQALREALAAEGFVYGPLEIFHRAAADGRVIFSAASLTKPGTFELGSMDAERYAGVNLFGVLPGPVPGVELLDDLLATGRELAARLDGELQSEQGEPFTAARIEALRAALVPVVQPAAMAPDEPVAG